MLLTLNEQNIPVIRWAGLDRAPGGEGFNADVSLSELESWRKQHVPFSVFLLTPPHTNGGSAAIIMSLVITSIVSANRRHSPGGWLINLFTVVSVTMAASFIATVMAGFYIVTSQSTH